MSEAYQVIENFNQWIEAIDPSGGQVIARFNRIDPLLLKGGETSGASRDFWVEWLGSDEDTAPSNLTQRQAWHEYQLTVLYPDALGFKERAELMAYDRHDLALRLRNPLYYVGGTESSSDDIGIEQRIRVSDSIEEHTSEIAALVMIWRVQISESEL